MKSIKYIIALWLCGVSIFVYVCAMLFILNVNAASDVFKNHSFMALSRGEQEAAIQVLVERISATLGLNKTPEISFYEYNWAAIASNTALPETIKNSGGHISINMTAITSTQEMQDRGYNSIEELVVQCVAHECRHSYQAQHAYDDTDYGRACLASFQGYISYTENVDGYRANFIEEDAESWGTSYMQQYFAGAVVQSAITSELPVDNQETNNISKQNVEQQEYSLSEQAYMKKEQLLERENERVYLKTTFENAQFQMAQAEHTQTMQREQQIQQIIANVVTQVKQISWPPLNIELAPVHTVAISEKISWMAAIVLLIGPVTVVILAYIVIQWIHLLQQERHKYQMIKQHHIMLHIPATPAMSCQAYYQLLHTK